ncbi:unnamed protein product [Tenebrio molitor]|nr:unnamed protein product [Tenebrio molitor]
MKALLIFAFVLCFFFSEVKALQCYECPTSDCTTLFKEKCSYEDACVSASFIGNGKLYRRRECVSLTSGTEYCAALTMLEGASCYVCQEDLCNGV